MAVGKGKVKNGRFGEEGIVSLKVNLHLRMLSMSEWKTPFIMPSVVYSLPVLRSRISV